MVCERSGQAFDEYLRQTGAVHVEGGQESVEMLTVRMNAELLIDVLICRAITPQHRDVGEGCEERTLGTQYLRAWGVRNQRVACG